MKLAPPAVVAIIQPAHLGDVMSSLPMAAVLKHEWPDVHILFAAHRYTKALVDACVHIDEFVDVEEVLSDPALLSQRKVGVFLNPYLADDLGRAARRAGVPIRVGNLRRPRTLQWANRFVYQGSQHNPLHICNVNLRYLAPLGIRAEYPPERLADLMGFDRIPALSPEFAAQLDPARFNLIVHPKSNKSGREWPAGYFNELVELLPKDRCKIFLTGVGHEREALQKECPALAAHDHVADLMGRMDLVQLLAFTARVGGMVCNSTGPLHIAAALGVRALGMFPGRARANVRKWAPIGRRAETLSVCDDCRPGPGRCPARYRGEPCRCMLEIRPQMAAQRVLQWIDQEKGPPA